MLVSYKMLLSYIPPKNKLCILYNFYFKISIIIYLILFFISNATFSGTISFNSSMFAFLIPEIEPNFVSNFFLLTSPIPSILSSSDEIILLLLSFL